MNKNNIHFLLDYLDELYPNAHCELKYSQDYELAIAVMLSAQTTDSAVNKVTPTLFSLFPSLSSLNDATIEDIEKIIQPLGLYKNKAKNIKDIAKKLLSDFNGNLPSNKDLLMTLPGIGNKSAGVIRAEVFKIPDLPVDTHISRISKRLKLAHSEDEPLKIEMNLKKMIDQSRWIKSHHQLIYFGRYFCTARKPECEKCKLKEFCKGK